MKVSAVGMAWYREEDYPRILKIMDDAHTLPTTYNKWHQLAEKRESQVKREGHFTVRAIIKPDEFLAWCKATGNKVDSSGRMAFANKVAKDSIDRAT